MALGPWRFRLRERVVEAEGRCSRVPGVLHAAERLLVNPLHAGDAAARIRLALRALGIASRHLGSGMSLIGASKVIMLYGGSDDPSVRLSSIYDPRGINVAPERSAMSKVESAWGPAQDAYLAVQLCCDHLLLAASLLPYQGIPGMDDMIEANRVFATQALENAGELARECADLVRGARDDVSGGIG